MHNRQSEIAKDFKGTITKLIKYDKSLVRLLIISLFLSFASSALSIIGPDKLKDITNGAPQEITGAVATQFEEAKAKAIKEAQDELDKVNYYPIVKLGFMYRF